MTSKKSEEMINDGSVLKAIYFYQEKFLMNKVNPHRIKEPCLPSISAFNFNIKEENISTRIQHKVTSVHKNKEFDKENLKKHTILKIAKILAIQKTGFEILNNTSFKKQINIFNGFSKTKNNNNNQQNYQAGLIESLQKHKYNHSSNLVDLEKVHYSNNSKSKTVNTERLNLPKLQKIAKIKFTVFKGKKQPKNLKNNSQVENLEQKNKQKEEKIKKKSAINPLNSELLLLANKCSCLLRNSDLKALFKSNEINLRNDFGKIREKLLFQQNPALKEILYKEKGKTYSK